MSILRFAARSLLASFFVVDGVKAVSNPEPLVPNAEKIADIAVPMAQRVAPAAIADFLPEDPKTWIRITGAAQVLGGLGLALGVARRPSAAVLGLTMLPHVLASRPDRTLPKGERSSSVFTRNLALLGGVVLAAQDTEGKPGLSWRAAEAKRSLAKGGRRQKKDLKKAGDKAVKKAKKVTDGIVGAVTP